MVSGHNPFVGKIAALDFADDVPDGPALVVLLRNEVNLHPAGPEVVAEGKRTLPALRNAGALEILQNRRDIVIADRDGNNVRLIAVRGNAGGIGKVGSGSDSGGFGVPWILEQVLH